ncbi:hypothetical protein D3C85_1211470 [compost metagenome]
MTTLRHQNGGLAFTAARIQNPQLSVTKGGEHGVEILPQDRLTQLPFGGAVNVPRKLFRDVIKIAIPHWESSIR